MFHQQNAQAIDQISKTQLQKLGSLRIEGDGNTYRYCKFSQLAAANIDTVKGDIFWFRTADLADENWVVTTVTAEATGLKAVGVAPVAVDVSAEAITSGNDYDYYGWLLVNGIGTVTDAAGSGVGALLVPTAANHGTAAAFTDPGNEELIFAQVLVDNGGADICRIFC